MSQRSQSRLQVECLEDRCTPSTSGFNFGSLFSQLEAKLSAAFSRFSPPSLPSFPSLPSLPKLKMPQLPSHRSLPSLSPPSFSRVSFPPLPHFSKTDFPHFPQFPQQFSTQFDSALHAARNALDHLHSRAEALFNDLAAALKGHFPFH